MKSLKEKFEECYRIAAEHVARRRREMPEGFAIPPSCDRQMFYGGPFIDPPIANLSTLTATTIEDIWTASQYTPIFANDPKAGKIYCVRAGGTMSLTGGTLIITPQLATSSTALGVSLTQGTVTIGSTAWVLQFDLVIRTVGTSGTCIGTGFIAIGGGVSSGTANPNVVTFGGTSAAINTTVNDGIQIRKTASTTNSMIPQYVYIFSPN